MDQELQTFYLCKYNNYYNRIVKRHYSLHAYLPYWIGVQGYCSFNENDGIRTTQKVNFDMLQKGEPDYLVVSSDGETIDSRWFIIESRRLRRNQYELTLQRDLLADYYSKILNSPLYVERGAVFDGSNLIFNSEGATYNQIKQSETLLQDESKIAWVVGYIPKDVNPATITATIGADTAKLFSVDGIANWTYYSNTTNSGTLFNTVFKDNNIIALKGYIGGSNTRISALNLENKTTNLVYSRYTTWAKAWDSIGWNPQGTAIVAGLSNAFLTAPITTPTMPISSSEETALISLKQTIVSTFNSKYSTILDSSFISNISEYKNSFLFDTTTSKYYKVDVDVSFELPALLNDESITPLNEDFDLWCFERATTRVTVTLTETTLTTIEATIPASTTRIHPNDSAYDVFFLPYGNITITDGTDFENNPLAALQMGIQIAASAGASAVYDVQLLPYHPANATIIDGDGKLNLSGINNATYQFVDDANNNHVSVVIWASSINRSFEIEHEISVNNYKESNELDLYRMVSPNYASIFEFSPAKNGGVNGIDVDVTFKPFTPYIHLAPKFGRLYGQDFNDARGLICSGDFSLPQVTSAWAEYELQNKNYALQFNRQVETLELQNKVQRINQIASIISGSVAGTMSGAVTGGMMGGPIGAAVGAAVGGVSSIVGGAIDFANAQKLRENNVDQMKDMYNWNLQNIQAIPYSLRNVGAQNVNNKIFPFIEYYTCSSEERQIFENKIKYNGMAVGAIQSIKENLDMSTQTDYQYIKGRFIRFEDLECSYNLANEINNELATGLYFDVKIK